VIIEADPAFHEFVQQRGTGEQAVIDKESRSAGDTANPTIVDVFCTAVLYLPLVWHLSTAATSNRGLFGVALQIIQAALGRALKGDVA
jgi:hypothetical protein